MPETNTGEDVAQQPPAKAPTKPNSEIIRRKTVSAGFGWRVGLFYAALFLIYGVQIPFMPVWLDWRGVSAREIAFVSAAPFFLRVIVSPGLAMIADRRGSHRLMILGLASVALVTAIALSQTVAHHIVVSASIVLAIAMMSMMPLTETIAVQGVQHAGLDYGRMRLWGSLSFIAIGFLAGALVTHFQAGIIIWLTALACVATLVFGFALPTARLHPTHSPEGPQARQNNSEKPQSSSSRFEGAWRLLRQPLFLLFLIAGGTIQAAHAMFYTFGALIWRSQGISATWIGGLWAIGVVAEILVFAYARGFFRNRDSSDTHVAMALLLAGGAAAVLRWVVMSFDPALWVLIPLQILHGLTYGAAHLGAIYFMSSAIPNNVMGTAQALYGSAAAGVAMGLAMLAAGPLYEAYEGGAYAAMAGLAAIGLSASLIIWRQWSGGLLWQSE